jgi:hypothetical protein
MARHQTATFLLGVLAICAAVVVLLVALYLGASFEASPRDVANSAKGHQMAPPAVVALIAGVVAIAGRRRGWALAVGCVGAAAAVVAVLLAVLLPGGGY